jgi:hypothetical protein
MWLRGFPITSASHYGLLGDVWLLLLPVRKRIRREGTGKPVSDAPALSGWLTHCCVSDLAPPFPHLLSKELIPSNWLCYLLYNERDDMRHARH